MNRPGDGNLHDAPVTAAERDELLALLEAIDMPTDPIAELNVQD